MSYSSIDDSQIPIFYWGEIRDGQVLVQARNLADHTYAFHHIAIMPDMHVGYGMPIGGVLATHDVIIPNAVGVDIGCGLIALQTDLSSDMCSTVLEQIVADIRSTIPVGFQHHTTPHKDYLPNSKYPKNGIIAQEIKNAAYEIGTLGGGNHFIEMQKDDDSCVWIMVHSGSRHIGKMVADHYNRAAKEYCRTVGDERAVKHDLAYIPIQSQVGRRYLEEMTYCCHFACKNRAFLLDQVVRVLYEYHSFEERCRIDIHHNYAAREKHYGRDVIVHRKGATSARRGEMGIIPGSPGSASYIVLGKGSEESFQSCSHGAGRTMGRREAIKRLNLSHEKEKLDRQGIIHGLYHKKALDEAPGAYKDIEHVLAAQSDLVDVCTRLRPLAVIKA